MAAPKSPRIAAAVADVRAGMTKYAAARKHGCSDMGLSQAMKRDNAIKSDACDPWFTTASPIPCVSQPEAHPEAAAAPDSTSP